MGQPILDLISGGFNIEFSILQSKGVGKLRLKWFGCKKRIYYA